MKFIRQNNIIVIFSETESHSDVSRYFNLNPNTAGFAQTCIEENSFDLALYGDSKGLRIKSDTENSLMSYRPFKAVAHIIESNQKLNDDDHHIIRRNLNR